MAAGEVLVRLEGRPGGGPQTGVATGVIDDPPERVFAALTDFAHYAEWVPFVERSAAEPQADGSVLSAQTLHLPALLGRRHFTLRAVSRVEAGGGGRLYTTRWTYVPGSGDVVRQDGAWTVTAYGPDGRQSLATCRLLADPGGLPAWAVDGATGKTLPWIFSGLRQQVHRGRYMEIGVAPRRP